MFTKLGRDEVFMARHMHKDVLAISAQGRIQGLDKGGGGDRKATATNQIHSNDLEACVMKCCCFWFHSVVLFVTLESSLLQKCSLYSGERSVPLGALVFINDIKFCKQGFYIYRNHPVCLPDRLFKSCPGCNFLMLPWIWIITQAKCSPLRKRVSLPRSKVIF